jgi:anti-sigma-K factor RskA
MTIDCRQVEALAEELALGHLTGAVRAEVLAHLDECHACRAEIASLTEVADSVLLLAPSARPDPGFDRRVLDRLVRARADADEPAGAGTVRSLAAAAQQRRRRRAILSVAAAVVIAVAVASALWAARDSTSTEVAAAMVDGRGATVGQVSLIADDGTTVQMDLPGWEQLAASYGASPEGEYQLQIRLDDGSRQTLAVAAAEAQPWRVHTTVDRADIASVAIADQDGRVWCQARFA